MHHIARGRFDWFPAVCGAALLAASCNNPEAPACLMRAGEWTEIVQSFGESPTTLRFYDHMDVVFETWDSAGIELVWSGPENVLAHRWVQWDTGVLELGHEDRCQWMRDLGQNVQLHIKSAPIPEIALHGQGRFDALVHALDAHVQIDAFAHAGYVEIESELDSLTLRLHAGVCSAVMHGRAQVLNLYSSGLSGIDAGGLEAKRAFVNQSGHPPLSFSAVDYAYVELNSPGNAVGTGGQPQAFTVVQNSTGELIWQD
jgi:hypothetical protein